MKKLTVLLFVVLGIATMQAQEETTYQNKIGIQLGISSPLGNFAGTDVNQAGQGFAKMGFAYSFNYARKINPYFAAKFQYSLNTNGVNTQAMADGLGADWSVSSDAWITNTLLVGLEITVPSPKIDVNFNIMSGLMFSQNPKQSFYYGNYEANYTYSNSSEMAVTSPFNIGFGLDYKLNNAWAIGIDCNYLIVKNKYEVSQQETYVIYGDVISDYTYATFEQKYSVVMITLGIKKQF